MHCLEIYYIMYYIMKTWKRFNINKTIYKKINNKVLENKWLHETINNNGIKIKGYNKKRKINLSRKFNKMRRY